MESRKATNEDRYRCVFLAKYQIINRETRMLRFLGCEIEIDPNGIGIRDIRQDYLKPVIRDTGRIEVRVYDENAVNLDQQDLLGDTTSAIDKCESALNAEKYSIL